MLQPTARRCPSMYSGVTMALALAYRRSGHQAELRASVAFHF
jgi:hypothetical protein